MKLNFKPFEKFLKKSNIFFTTIGILKFLFTFALPKKG